MLEDALKEEKQSLEEMIRKLQPIVDEFLKVELRLQHVNALLGIDPTVNGRGDYPKINWATLWRQPGWPTRGHWGHSVFKRLNPHIHDMNHHDCTL